MKLKKGDRVRHKLCGLFMTVTKVVETIAVCKRDEPTFSKFEPDKPIYTAICSIENLEILD